MHVLVIPSEEYLPPDNHLAGIFQHHQASILKYAGNKVGALSIKQSLSITMIVKAIIFKLIGKKTKNELESLSIFSILKKGWNKIIHPNLFISEDHIQDIPVVRIDGFYFHPPKENANYFGWVIAGLAAYKKYTSIYGRPDIIHAHNALYAGLLAKKIKKKWGIPFVLTEHSTVFARELINSKLLKRKIQSAYLSSDALFAVSDPFSSLLNKRFPMVNFETLANVLDPYLEMKPFVNRDINNDKIRLINIGELHPKKDQKNLLYAFALIIADRKDIELTIVGDGIEEINLKQLAKDLNIDSNVFFAGRQSREQIYNHLIQSDILVLSSKYETFGVVIIEAMLFGKPVIVTRCGGPEGFVTSKFGYTINPGNTEELIDAIQAAISNLDQFNAFEIREETIRKFGKDAFLKRINNVYEQIARKL